MEDSSSHQSSLRLGGGVSIFGVRLHLGSDDFFLPSAVGIVCRVGLLGFYAGLYVFVWLEGSASSDVSNDNYTVTQSNKTYPCMESHSLLSFMIATLVVLTLNSFILILLAWNSRKGAIWMDPRFLYQNSHPRKWVTPLLYLSLAGHLSGVAVLIAGTCFVVSAWTTPDCIVEVNYPLCIITLGIAIEYTALSLIVGVFYLVAKDKPCFKNVWRRKSQDKSRGILHSLCSFLCFGESKVSYFDDVADLLDEVFPDDQFVPTDIVAALVLIYAHEQVREVQLRSVGLGTLAGSQIQSSTPLPNIYRQFSTFPEWQSSDKLLRFMEYSAAIYGFKMFIIEGSNPWGRLRHLSRHAVCCSCCCCCSFFRPRESHFDFVNDDNCCLCNMAAVKASLPFLDEDDVVYASFRNEFLETPFIVAIDRETSTVVIAVRGTLSVSDVITDLVAKPRRISEAVSSSGYIDETERDCLTQMFEGYSCHSGMMAAALYVYGELKEKHLLDRAFARCPDFNLAVTGHSLGAGTATILAFLLKPKYPDVKCYAYGPPGGLLNAKAAEASREFSVSVVVGSDIIPRTTIKAVHNLRSQMAEVLRETEISKYNILSHGLLGQCCGSRRAWIKRIEDDFARIEEHRQRRQANSEQGQLGQNASYTPQAERRLLSSSNGSSGSVLTAENYGSTNYDEMFPPGDLIFFERSLSENREIVNVSHKNPSFFEHIIVTPAMMSDHFPATYVTTLRDANR